MYLSGKSCHTDLVLIANLKQTAGRLRKEAFTLYLVARDPRTPWYAKVLVAGIVAYAFSPVDLIPDFVPVFGYLDDLILIPMGVALAVKLVSDSVLNECRARAHDALQTEKPVSWVAGAVVVVVWLVLATAFVIWILGAFVV